MPFPPPEPFRMYTGDERALIAGYILHMREGILKAADSTGSPPAGSTLDWGEGSYNYWENAEAVTRWLLYWIGYPVRKGKLYVPPQG